MFGLYSLVNHYFFSKFTHFSTFLVHTEIIERLGLTTYGKGGGGYGNYLASISPLVASRGSFFNWMNSFFIRETSGPLTASVASADESISLVTRSHVLNIST